MTWMLLHDKPCTVKVSGLKEKTTAEAVVLQFSKIIRFT